MVFTCRDFCRMAASPEISALDRETLEFFFNAVDRHFAVLDAEGRVQLANLSFRRFTGPTGGAHDSKLSAMLTPQAAERFAEAIAALSPGQSTKPLVLRFRIGREERDAAAVIQRAATGELYYSAREVEAGDADKGADCSPTQIKFACEPETAAACTQSQECFSLGLEISSSALWDTRILDRSHRVEGLWSLFTDAPPAVDFFPKGFFERVRAEDQDAVRTAWRKHVSGDAPFRVRHGFIGAGERVITVETAVKVYRNAQTGRPERIVGMMHKLIQDRLAAASASAPADGGGGPALEKGERLSLLIAEDNPMVRRVLQTLLQPLEVDAAYVENGADAVDAARNARFHAILMDIKMPRMNGFDAARIIRAEEAERNDGRSTPIFALTSQTGEAFINQVEEAGFTAVLDKPVQLDQLCTLLERHVKQYACNSDACRAA